MFFRSFVFRCCTRKQGSDVKVVVPWLCQTFYSPLKVPFSVPKAVLVKSDSVFIRPEEIVELTERLSWFMNFVMISVVLRFHCNHFHHTFAFHTHILTKSCTHILICVPCKDTTCFSWEAHASLLCVKLPLTLSSKRTTKPVYLNFATSKIRDMNWQQCSFGTYFKMLKNRFSFTSVKIYRTDSMRNTKKRRWKISYEMRSCCS